ncbi:aldo/keto reductase [Ruminococcus sp. JL13D9]|uniref:aldo/keto reductase n=1 Tax=Ruminococcus sp. JL13D9 TaxID=3233381 RepID=UPI00389B35A0
MYKSSACREISVSSSGISKSTHETVTAIAKSHGKTSAQIILRWHLQAGYIAIPGSSNPDHIAENYRIFDFELTDDEMRQIAAVNKNQRYENW